MTDACRQSGRIRRWRRMRAVAACLLAAAVSPAIAGEASRDAADAVHLRVGGVVLGRLEITAIGSDRVWYRTTTGGRGSVPLAAVRSLRFAAMPHVAEAETLAAAGNPAAAAARLAESARVPGPAGDWAARRVIAWAAASDPVAAVDVAAARLTQDGDLAWVLRVERSVAAATAATGTIATPAEAVAAAGRRLDRLRLGFEAAPPPGFPVGAMPEARRGLARLRDLLASVPTRDDVGRLGPAHGRGGGAAEDHAAEDHAGDRPVLADAAAVRAALARGEVDRILASLASAEGPDPDTFDARLLADLAAAADRAGHPVLASACWIRCAVLHPAAAAAAAWEQAARIHEGPLGDPAAAGRIRAHAATLADAGAMADGPNLRGRGVVPAVRRR